MMAGIERYASAAMKLRILNNDAPHWLVNHKRARYIFAITIATPLWMKSAEFRDLRSLAIRLTRETGVPHVLDHVIPISHPHVCGLNVPWNVEVVPHKVNVYKSNRWAPDQLELFDAVPLPVL